MEFDFLTRLLKFGAINFTQESVNGDIGIRWNSDISFTLLLLKVMASPGVFELEPVVEPSALPSGVKVKIRFYFELDELELGRLFKFLDSLNEFLSWICYLLWCVIGH